VHIFEQGSAEIECHLKFRDWLRNNPEDKDTYAELKKNLAIKFPHDIALYCSGKDAFIANVDAKAGWDGFRFVVAMMPKEWEAYHRISTELKHPLSKDNHYHFALYKKVQIVGAAHVELLNQAEAAIRAIDIDEQCEDSDYGIYMRQIIEKWLKSQKRNVRI
jgi:hypothetical protein